MKKIILLMILCFVLVACEDDTIQVEYTERGYTIEEAGRLTYDQDYNMSTAYMIDEKTMCLVGFGNENKENIYYQINIDTGEKIETDSDACVVSYTNTLNDEIEIYTSESHDDKQLVYHSEVYYLKNGKIKYLFEDDFIYDTNDLSEYQRGGLNKFYSHKDKTWYLYWANKNEYVIYEVKDGEVSGGEKIYLMDNYTMSEMSLTSDFLIFQFENDTDKKIVIAGDHTYQLEKEQEYMISDDYLILYENNVIDSLIVKGTQKEMVLSEPIRLQGFGVLNDMIIYRDLSTGTWCIAKIMDKMITVYQTSFENKTVEYTFSPSEESFIFKVDEDDSNQAIFYLMKLDSRV